MKDRHATRDALLHYLQVTGARRVAVIIDYMQQHHGVEPRATYVALDRLVDAGKVTRLRRGFYAIV